MRLPFPSEVAKLFVGADMFVEGSAAYRLMKEIDGAPNVVGTWPIYGARARFFYGVKLRQAFYEPITGFDSVRAQVVEALRLDAQHVPFGLLPDVLTSFWVYPSAATAPAGRLELPSLRERDRQRHAVRLIGVAGDDLVFRNSWGVGWGDSGNGYLSREYFERYETETWVSRPATVGWTWFSDSRFQSASTERQLAVAYMTPNPRWLSKLRVRGERLRLINYEMISVEELCRVDIYEVRNGLGLRLGWAHSYHHRDRDRTILKELFVWPRYRRQGIGTLLEEIAADRGRQYGAGSIELWLHEADNRRPLRAAAEAFGKARGYTWGFSMRSHPRVPQIAERPLS